MFAAVLTACAASSQAIGEAAEIIRRGEADAMLSGGAHSMIHPFGVTGFNLLTALSDLRSAQDNFMSVWLNYYASRMALVRDITPHPWIVANRDVIS